MDRYPRFETGNGLLTVLCDGWDSLPTALLLNLDRDKATPFLSAEAEGRIDIPINAFLYQAEGRTVLIDAGGAGLHPGLGAVQKHLAALGVTEAQIDTVFCTHLHPDHIGGLLRDGAAVFPKASLRIHPAEQAFWQDPALEAQAPAEFQAVIHGARAVLRAYGDRIAVFSDGEEIAPGAVAVHLPGHTPGHSGLRIGPAETGLLIWADIVHVADVQLGLPDTSILFDADPAQAAITRKALCEQVADSGLHLAGGHLPGIGTLRRAAGGYAFHPTA